jgi:preprotein translocase subunit SecG
VRRASLTVFSLALLALLALAPAAAAENDGRGFYGASDDKVVTKAGFILILFFPVLVTVLSLLQRRLDKRKAARKAAREAQLGHAQWRGGW